MKYATKRATSEAFAHLLADERTDLADKRLAV